MVIKFPFENAGRNLFGVLYRPVAKVSFKSLKEDIWTTTWMVVDSGADFTILPRYLSEDLGVSLEHDCIKDSTAGIGGEEGIYLCKRKMKARIGSFERNVPLAFLDNNEIPALLGRLGFLETFDAEFLKTHVLALKD